MVDGDLRGEGCGTVRMRNEGLEFIAFIGLGMCSICGLLKRMNTGRL